MVKAMIAISHSAANQLDVSDLLRFDVFHLLAGEARSFAPNLFV